MLSNAPLKKSTVLFATDMYKESAVRHPWQRKRCNRCVALSSGVALDAKLHSILTSVQPLCVRSSSSPHKGEDAR